MKSLVLFIIFITNSLLVSAQIFDVDTLLFSGNSEKRINLVVLSEGYQPDELGEFITHATSFKNSMFSQSPFLEYINYFNVFAIKIPSNESGADHPATATDVNESEITPTFVDTYFNATFDAFGYHRYIYYGIDYTDAASTEVKINSVLADNFPTYDQALILVNTTEYGGTGGKFPIASISSYDIAIHELGHSLFNLKDEYFLPDIYYAEAINMTQETNTSLIKWKNWIGTNGVDINPYGSSGVSATWYKPRHLQCKMELLNKPFCAVCKEGIIEKIHDLISPIDSYTPENITINTPSFPLDFQLNLIKTIPNSLESIWILNANNIDNNVDNISIEETDLKTGTNTLTAVINDATTSLRVDNHETLHVYTVTWSINYSTLGIETIVSDVNSFNMSVFPNPTNDVINFTLENTLDTPLKLEIISMDGKTIQSYNVTNSENLQIDMNTWSQGIYLAKVYANNDLIANKRIVKN
ncbi:peptidase M64 [Pseudalgibacter alginicilyticus]|uniref:Peptidase M64 n=1 Tax=Pseudalgibacter alginicilyticus TaxID=1736674 RepID=A0A0N7HYB6_9FLAO|nr:M64 family metallopeptidase [Pseudalgibacter alginicilyticus]ALJ04798.1 peptidase M64 [Pseudalgibacter alginicilyticus]